MNEVSEVDPSLLLDAFLAWTGWKQEASPRRSRAFLAEAFTTEIA